MVQETAVRRFLGLSPDEQLDERGVHLPAQQAHAGATDEPVVSEQWLTNSELEERFSADDTLASALPDRDVLVKRADIAPAIVLFDGVPAPSNSLGAVHCIGDSRWVMDSRGESPAALVLPYPSHRVVLWGQNGAIRVFALRDRE